MTVLPVAALGPEWQVAGIGAPSGPAAADQAVSPSGGSFGDALVEQIGKLSDLQETAATQSTALANGTATDVGAVVMAVEKAQLAMQLAGQIRTRAAEAVNDIFHTQI